MLNMVGTLVFGCLEAAVLRAALCSEETLRRAATLCGAALSAGGLAGFGLAQRPWTAAAAYAAVGLGQGLHHSGFVVNYVEVGDLDAGMLAGLGNSARL